MSDPVDKVNLNMRQSETYAHQFNVFTDDAKTIAANVLGYTATLQMRSGSGRALLHSATTVNGQLSINDTSVMLEIPYSVINAWTFKAAQYDLYINSPTNKPIAIARGSVVVHQSITAIP
jgi:hypothetical protein